MAYADLILNGDPETYLKAVTEYRPLDTKKQRARMQDNYIGDIGDYGKYGLLREVVTSGLTLSVNWYKVVPKKTGKQADGKYISYLSTPELYRAYDPILFDALHKIVCDDNIRRIERVENKNLLNASFFSREVCADRNGWHCEALERTKEAEIVFLDPDNGLETPNMYYTGRATEKHVKWLELKDYYEREQSVILYQHRPQMTKKEQCIEGIKIFQTECLQADNVMLLEFPKYTNRFYFMFVHERHLANFQKICSSMICNWGKNGFCREILLEW